MSLQLQASAGISIGDISELIDGAVDQLRPQPDARPFYFTRAATVYADGVNNAFVLGFGGPPSGSLWQIRWVTTFGSDAFTPLASSASPAVPLQGAMFAGDPVTSPSLAQILLTNITFPITRYVPDTTTWCHPNQDLFITTGIASGASYTPTAGQQIGAVVGIEEWREADVSRNSGR
jgi:hypothetical protein